jgi:hypothetical protein
MRVTVNGKDVPFTTAPGFTRALARRPRARLPGRDDPRKVKVDGFFSALGQRPGPEGDRADHHHGAVRDGGVRPDRGGAVEFFPTRIRYTAMSLPYHIGNGWFGGFCRRPPSRWWPRRATSTSGLWYPIGFALMTFVIGLLFVPETKDRDITTYDASPLTDGPSATTKPRHWRAFRLSCCQGATVGTPQCMMRAISPGRVPSRERASH